MFGGYNDSLHNLSLVLFPPPQLSEHWDQEVQSAQTANLQFGGHIPVLGLQPIHGQLQVVLAIMENVEISGKFYLIKSFPILL